MGIVEWVKKNKFKALVVVVVAYVLLKFLVPAVARFWPHIRREAC